KETLADDADGAAVTVWYTVTRSGTTAPVRSDETGYTVSINNYTELNEDFENNGDVTLADGDELTLSTSGAILYGPASIKRPRVQHSPQIINSCLLVGSTCKIKFPTLFLNFRVGLIAEEEFNDDSGVTIIFYDLANNETERFHVDLSSTATWVERVMTNGPACSIVIASQTSILVDNITIKF
ncbi:hypothetical protein NG99_26970, partial [Erwinia typographi]